jgi:outer membrane protein assembly factor BamB
MRRSLSHVATSVLAVLVVAAGATPASAMPGDRLWLRLYNSGPAGTDGTRDLALTPDGSKLIVTGFPQTIAYDAVTGATSWDFATTFDSTVVGANDARVFLSCCTNLLGSYDPATGTKQYLKTFAAPESQGVAFEMAISANGRRVLIGGGASTWTGSGYDNDWVTTAVAAGTGTMLWSRRYDGPLDGADYDVLADVATTSDGGLVVAAGTSTNTSGQATTTVIAYDGVSGKRLWLKRLGTGWGNAVDLSPDGSTVFVTGDTGFRTTALDAATGAKLWRKGFAGVSDGENFGYDVAVTPDGSKVLVAGEHDHALAITARDATTGDWVWTKTYMGPGGYSRAVALSITPDGSAVVVTGIDAVLVNGDTIYDSSFDVFTSAYDPGTGTRMWLRRYDDAAGLRDFPQGVVTAPDSSAAFVTGWTKGPSGTDDYLTLAYEV